MKLFIPVKYQHKKEPVLVNAVADMRAISRSCPNTFSCRCIICPKSDFSLTQRYSGDIKDYHHVTSRKGDKWAAVVLSNLDYNS